MSDEIRMGVTRATAIVAANAAIHHCYPGNFMSQFDISDYGLRWGNFAGHMQVLFRHARTNQGIWLRLSAIVVFMEERGRDFPIEKVIISFETGDEKPEFTYFECNFAPGGVQVSKLDKSPLE